MGIREPTTIFRRRISGARGRLLRHALMRQERGLPGEPEHVALRGSWVTAPDGGAA